MSPTPVILDVDPGHDDAVAIMLACAAPDLDLLAVTTVAGNAPLEKTTRNVLRVLSLIGHTDLPVAAGASSPSAARCTPPRTSTARAGWKGRRSRPPPSNPTNAPRRSSSPTPCAKLPNP